MASNTRKIKQISARRARVNDPDERIASQATVSAEFDLTTIIDAITSLQKVDVERLQRRFKLQASDHRDLMNGQDEHDANLKLGQKSDLRENDDELDPAQKDIQSETNNQSEEKEKELRTIRDDTDTNDQASSKQENEICQLKLSLEAAYKDVESLNQKVMECQTELKAKEKRLKEQDKEMEDIKRAKDEALIRLSQEVGQKVSEGNPNITDLSDRNRPTKLGEIYSELYDNEWTNAFEVLTQTCQMKDRKAIELLHKILKESNKHASTLSQSNMKMIEKLVIGSSEEPSPDCKRLLREARKRINIEKAEDHIQAFTKTFPSWKERTYMMKPQVDIYSKKCFELCWLMSIQDPPLVFSQEPRRGVRFDTNVYKLFTLSGDTFDYMVWPALFLYKDGPILSKGVAEPCLAPETNSTSTVSRSTTKDNKSFDGMSEEKKSGSESDRMDKDKDQTRADVALSLKANPGRKMAQTYSANLSKSKIYSPRPITPNNTQSYELTHKVQAMLEKVSKKVYEQV